MALVLTDGRVQVVNTTTFEEIMAWEASDNIHPIAFSPNGQIIGLSSFDPEIGKRTFGLWDLSCGKRLWRNTLEYSKSHNYTAQVKFSPNSQVAAFRWADLGYDRDDLWAIVEIATGEEERWVSGNESLAFDPESHLVAIGTEDFLFGVEDSFTSLRPPLRDRNITTYETGTASPGEKSCFKLYGPAQKPCTIWSMALSTAGKLAAVSSRGSLRLHSRTVQLWDTETGMEVGRYVIEGEIRNLSFVNDRYLVCNQGQLPVPHSFPDEQEADSKERRKEAQDSLYVGSQWVYKGLERILWLPPAYRSEASVMRGETLGLAHESGAIRIVKFDIAETPY